MGIVSGIVVFTMIWWMVLFCVLPIGIPRDYEEREKHHVNMKQKLVITTAISIIIWVGVYFFIDSDLINFRRIALEN